jgi:hypothetical protein
MNKQSVELIKQVSLMMTSYRLSLETWRSAMTDLAIWHSLCDMQSRPEEFDIEFNTTPEEAMEQIIRDYWQPVSIDDDGYEGIDNMVRAYLIETKLARDVYEDDNNA